MARRGRPWSIVTSMMLPHVRTAEPSWHRTAVWVVMAGLSAIVAAYALSFLVRGAAAFPSACPRLVPRSPVGNLPARDARRGCAPGRAASVPENALDPPACVAPASGESLRGVCVRHRDGRHVHGRIFLRRLDHACRLRPARLLHSYFHPRGLCAHPAAPESPNIARP